MEMMSTIRHSYSLQPGMMEVSYDASDLLSYRLIDSIDIEAEANDFKSWNRKHPDMWTSDDIINWIYSVAVPLNINLDKLRGECFQGLTGLQLCRLSLQGFVERDHINGAQLYNCLHELLRQSQFIPPAEFSDLDDCLDDIDDLQSFAQCQKLDLDKWECFSPSTQILPSLHTFLDPFDDMGSFDDSYTTLIYSSLSPQPTSSLDSDRTHILPDPGYESGGSSSDPSVSNHSSVSPSSTFGNSPSVNQSTSNQSSTANKCNSSSSSSSLKRTSIPLPPPPPLSSIDCLTPVASADVTVVATKPPGKRKVGRPPKIRVTLGSSSSSSSDECSSPSPPKKSKKKNTHLWRFMRSLLEDPVYNPSSIKWENKFEGVFRIVPGQSKVIAKLWGQRKNNPSMTFDKMSRSLRWCRTYGFLSEVPKNGNYPKKLCFRFGDRALDWQI